MRPRFTGADVPLKSCACLFFVGARCVSSAVVVRDMKLESDFVGECKEAREAVCVTIGGILTLSRNVAVKDRW